jgi:p-cumate 2,3-dioxygenase beta subunit
MTAARPLTRGDVEDLLFLEADLLDAWRLDDWLKLLDDDATYLVPPNDKPDDDPRFTLFTIADDMVRLRERVIRLKDPNCHAEFPHSRTRRLITNVRITGQTGDITQVSANFIVHRFRRHQDPRVFVGYYRFKLVRRGADLKILERRAVLDSEELGLLGAVSFIL